MNDTQLKKFLTARGIKQRFVALNAKIPEETISRIVNGEREATDIQKKAIAKVLDTTVNDLF